MAPFLRLGRRSLTLAAALLTACRDEPKPAAESSAPVLAITSSMWYEETGRYFQVSPTGKQAIFGAGPRARFFDLSTGAEDSATWRGTFTEVRGGVFDAQGALWRLGAFTDTMGWYQDAGGVLKRLMLPPTALPRPSPSGTNVTWYQAGDSAVTIGATGAEKVVRLDGTVSGLAWAPAGDAVFATALHANGLTSLVRISLDGTITVIRRSLDAAPATNTLAPSPDGRTIYLALASDTVPANNVRHDPEATHRDLDIYAISLPDGRLSRVVQLPGDDCCPAIAAGALFWTHNDPGAEVVVFPMSGGAPRAVADHGFLPRWSPDGRQIAFTRGYFRLSDYGLDMDGWVVGLDSAGAVTSPPKAWITGFGEDMGPVWSPDAKWVAYHSHRSPNAEPLYDSPGRTDDTWLQRVGGGPEIRLTDFGFEVGPPDWAPDGRRLIFDMWEKTGPPRIAKPWILTIDPTTGRPLDTKRMPLPAGVKSLAGEAWSPVGEEIAFVERVDESRQALWISRPDGAGARKLVEFACYTIAGVDWSPDGRELLYGAVTDGRMQIFAVSRDGGVPRQLTHESANILHPAVSPDGKLVAASRIPWRKELRRMKLP